MVTLWWFFGSMWLWFLFFLPFSSSDVCYNEIYLHRINAFLPSSGPFCLASFTETEYVPPSLTEDQIIRLSIIKQKPNVNPVVYHAVGEAVIPLQLPVALSGDLCSHYQFIEIGRNLSSSCHLVIDQSNCPGFAAETFFNRIVSIYENDTYELPFELANGTDFLPSRWINGNCQDLISQAELRLLLNQSVLTMGTLRLQYSPPVVGLHQLKFTVLFVNSIDGLYAPIEDTRAVYGTQGNNTQPLTFPSMGNCDGHSRSPIVFKQNMSTGCLMRVSSCSDALNKIQRFVETYLPTHILANSSSSNAIPVTHIETSQPLPSNCAIPITFHLDFFYAKIGPIMAYREEPVGIYIYQQLVGIEIDEEMNLPITFKIRFTDVSKEATSVFADLPYIDLRLPADTFYPFIRSHSPSYSLASIFVILLLIG